MKRSTQIFVFIVMLSALLFAAFSLGHSAPGEEVRVWVQFVPGQKANVQASLQGAGAVFHYQFDELDAFVVTLPAAALNGIQRNPNVVEVEEDVPRQLFGSGAGELARLASSRLLNVPSSSQQVMPYGVKRVQAPGVWTEGFTGQDRKVCVVDSGYYRDHEDFVDVPVSGYSQVGTSWDTDGIGHGTHVAGTIAAQDNNKGVVGVAPGVSLFIVKVFNDNGQWTLASDLVDAINRCQNAGANVISMSLGGSRANGQERRAFNNLYNQGILHVAAAGNGGNTSYSYPASYDSVISVAATDINDQVADFSQQNDQVELAAPGVGVWSTVPFIETNTLTVDGVTYNGNWIEFAARGTASGALVNGGLCDSTGAWSGMVVLCERGQISFYDKVRNVQNSGGVAAVIYNNEPGNFFGTLGSGNSSNIPAISLSQEDGKYLVNNKLGSSGEVESSVVKPASGYEAWNGTSMATPHVSAAAALVWSANTSWTNAQIREALQQTAFDLGPSGRDNAYGYGLVQALGAYNYLVDNGGGSDPGDPGDPVGTLSVSVSTDKDSYVNKETVRISVTVTDGTDPVSGAAVRVEVTTANGNRFAGEGTTNSAGEATFTHRVNSRRDGVGTYTVDAFATKDGYEPGSGSTTFKVTN